MAISEAVIRIINSVSDPYARLLNEFVEDVHSAPDKILEIKEEYLGRLHRISEGECCKAVGRYLRYSLKSLYKGYKEQYARDASRLVLDGKPKDVEFTAEERTAIAAAFIHMCRKLCGDAPLSML